MLFPCLDMHVRKEKKGNWRKEDQGRGENLGPNRGEENLGPQIREKKRKEIPFLFVTLHFPRDLKRGPRDKFPQFSSLLTLLFKWGILTFCLLFSPHKFLAKKEQLTSHSLFSMPNQGF